MTAAAERFATARQAADAVLFEGYVLYPYRASSAKNRMRWQFGVLVPPAWASASGEPVLQRTEILMEPRADAALHAELRFLHAQRRTVERILLDGEFEPTDELQLPDRVLVPWDEGVEERVEVSVDVAVLTAEDVVLPFTVPATEDSEIVTGADGFPAGRVVRRRERLEGVLRLSAEELPGPYRVLRLTAVAENTGSALASNREEALPHALVSAHLMLRLTAGYFVSMTDPPEWAKAAVAECRNENTWPVLAGDDAAANVVLSSPIILEDHPRIAPESPGALYDATEIDEILALRTAALTDEEKRQARGTDERAAAVIDLADSMPPEVMERLHGAVRALREVTGPQDSPAAVPETPWWDPGADASVDPARDRVMVGDTWVAAGSRVVLRPGRRRTDAQDLFLHGRSAQVEAVLHDVDGGVHLAVTVDGDPGAEIRREQGRFLYFQPDELAPLEDA
ncbi:hypothetical protein ACFYWP_35340 [Actinacidiphila glaucinigra]|uniref:hypothetical protein n=1 Tax=Actinacidiphila glaucinigra TaxID=235986 RepID=UPI0036CA9CC2